MGFSLRGAQEESRAAFDRVVALGQARSTELREFIDQESAPVVQHVVDTLQDAQIPVTAKVEEQARSYVESAVALDSACWLHGSPPQEGADLLAEAGIRDWMNAHIDSGKELADRVAAVESRLSQAWEDGYAVGWDHGWYEANDAGYNDGYHYGWYDGYSRGWWDRDYYGD
ncbi:MAG: hypothetical protein AAFY60_05085 [Myxococcota bacterium]